MANKQTESKLALINTSKCDRTEKLTLKGTDGTAIEANIKKHIDFETKAAMVYYIADLVVEEDVDNYNPAAFDIAVGNAVLLYLTDLETSSVDLHQIDRVLASTNIVDAVYECDLDAVKRDAWHLIQHRVKVHEHRATLGELGKSLVELVQSLVKMNEEVGDAADVQELVELGRKLADKDRQEDVVATIVEMNKAKEG